MHETMELIVELGEDATSMRTYQAIFLPALLQTEDYARTSIESGRAWVRPTEVDTLVELRMRRQDRLTQTRLHQPDRRDHRGVAAAPGGWPSCHAGAA